MHQPSGLVLSLQSDYSHYLLVVCLHELRKIEKAVSNFFAKPAKKRLCSAGLKVFLREGQGQCCSAATDDAIVTHRLVVLCCEIWHCVGNEIIKCK